MARKKILPKRLGPVRIPKALRKVGDKALADPRTAGIVSEALASVAALVVARKAAGGLRVPRWPGLLWPAGRSAASPMCSCRLWRMP